MVLKRSIKEATRRGGHGWAQPPGEANTVGTLGTAGTMGTTSTGTTGTAPGTAGTAPGTAGTVPGTAGTVLGTAGTAPGHSWHSWDSERNPCADDMVSSRLLKALSISLIN